MWRFLCFLGVIFGVIFSLEAIGDKANPALPLVLTEGCPSAFVEGVNVIAGIYCEREVDLVIPGCEPLVYEHTYASVFPCGWNDNTLGFAGEISDPRLLSSKVSCYDFAPPGSARFTCSGPARDKKEMTLSLDPKLHGKGLTNCAHADFSGQYDPKNTKIFANRNSGHLHAVAGTGEKLFFSGNRGQAYFIERRELPSGFSVHYDYTNRGLNRMILKPPRNFADKREALQQTIFQNATKAIVDSMISITRSELLMEMHGSNGKKVSMKFVPFDYNNVRRLCVKEIIRPHGPDYTYTYTRLPSSNEAKICSKSWPSKRFLNFDYYHEEPPSSPKFFRVKHLMVSTDAEPFVTHRFFYQINPDESGVTEVLSTNKKRYHYNQDQYLTCIESFDEKNELYTKENLYWFDNGDLRAKVISGKMALLRRQFIFMRQIIILTMSTTVGI